MVEHEWRTSIMDEKPLSPAARAGLVVNAAFTILLFYLTAILFMAGFTALALLLLLVTMAAARFGMASFVGRLLQVPVRLIAILGKKLWLPSETAYRVALTPEDAPGLFATARALSQRSALAPPESIAIEMHTNAWVELRGYRRGAGRTSLGIGFDLLAGLGVSEVEAVLAHELAHARLVQRGFSRWLKKGLARLSQVTTELSACAAAYRQADARSDLAETTMRVFDALTRRAARLVATYSRQDEFAADRGAVELCAAGAVRSALGRLDVLDEAASGLPWSERLARLQPGEAFTAWLVSELTGPGRGDSPESLRHAVDPYSTHPAMRDRLAALPADDASLRDTRPGIALLVDPDRVAGRLAAEIQGVIAVQERRDTQRLARETRKLCRPEGSSVVSFLGAMGIIVALVVGVIGAADGFPLDMMGIAVATLAAGVVLVRLPRYRDRRPLPVPAYGTLSNPRPPETQEQLAAAEEAIVAELRASAAVERTRRARCAMLVRTSYAALQQRDYLRAHVAARLALELKKTSIEAGLVYAIAAAGLGNVQQAHGRLGVIRRKVGFQTLATKWGAAWALSLLDDWSCDGILDGAAALDAARHGGGARVGRRGSGPRSRRGVIDRPRARVRSRPARRAHRHFLPSRSRSPLCAGGEYRVCRARVIAGRPRGGQAPPPGRAEIRGCEIHERANRRQPVSRDPGPSQRSHRAAARLYSVDRDRAGRVADVGRAIDSGVRVHRGDRASLSRDDRDRDAGKRVGP